MTLPRKVATQDEIPEALREYYKQTSDGTWELDLEDSGALGDAGKRALDREREERRKAAQALKELQEKYEGLDPIKAKEALTKIEELEIEKLKAEKQYDEAAERRVQGRVRALEQQIAALNDQIKAEQGKVQQIRDRWARTAIDDQISKVALESGADPKKLKFLVNEARSLWRLDDQDQPQPMEQDEHGEWRIVYGAEAGKPMSMAEQIKGMLKEHPFFALETSGGNTYQGRGAGVGPYTITRAEARNTALFQQRYEAANKAGQQLTVIDN